MSPRIRSALRTGGLHLVCLLISAGLFALPLIYLALQAFKTYTGFLQDPTGIPHPWTASNFSQAWSQGDFSTEMVNSLLYAVLPDVATLILGVFLAFPISAATSGARTRCTRSSCSPDSCPPA